MKAVTPMRWIELVAGSSEMRPNRRSPHLLNLVAVFRGNHSDFTDQERLFQTIKSRQANGGSQPQPRRLPIRQLNIKRRARLGACNGCDNCVRPVEPKTQYGSLLGAAATCIVNIS